MITLREALDDDVWTILKLNQRQQGHVRADPLFSDPAKLTRALRDPGSRWMVAEEEGALVSVFAALVDPALGIAKISRMFVEPTLAACTGVVAAGLRAFLKHLKTDTPSLEVVFTSTFTMPLAIQKLTLAEGFKVLGVFPNAIGIDDDCLNGLSVYYYSDRASLARDEGLRLHAAIRPFYALVAKALGLPPAENPPEISIPHSGEPVPLPTLELIEAPAYVLRRFQELCRRRSQMVTFYPFFYPNCVITDPDGQIEIFIRMIHRTRFAAVIAEHLMIQVDPRALFETLFTIMRERHINFIELIHDAGDFEGTEIIVASGFTPCGYIPAFKKQGDRRRDYVIYGRSFEVLCRPDLSKVPGDYARFYAKYMRHERERMEALTPDDDDPPA